MVKITVSALIIIVVFAHVQFGHCTRVIFRQNEELLKMRQKTAPTEMGVTDVAVSNIITAPQHCPPGQMLDDRRICRKVF